jgi:DNA-binding transcriptional LysR family regulator
MRRLPSFFALRAFEAAARLESFAAAAAELHLTPSAVSHQIRSLEGYFGRALFLRLHRRIEPTPDGARLLLHLSRTFDALEAACAELGRDGLAQTLAQTLALHCAPSFAAKWLGPRLRDFMRTHAEIDVRLTASADPIDLPRRQEIDILIAYGAPRARQGIVAEALGTEPVTALVAPALRGAAPDRLVLIESAVNPVIWSDWFALNGLAMPKPARRPAFDRGSLAIAAAVQGIGAVLETTRFAEEELASGALVPLGGDAFRPVPRALHFLCYRQAQGGLPKVAAFRAWLFAALRQDGMDAPAIA